ncbi:MAG: dihydrolipoyl dehydrogenase [Rhodospirillaceae bacterium]|nr:dihydrolipoyl dehydrogenase [Rhodospirillaceae bacterium]
MAEQRYDLIVIGAGPGGYVAAIRAAQLGMKVACVEKRVTLGGTCLNIGCIPSKALLHSSEKYEEARHGLAAHGVTVAGATLDLAALMKRKDKVVEGLTKGIEMLFRKNGVAWIRGTARLAGGGTVAVRLNDGGETVLEAERILIATGSDVAPLPGVAIDEKRIVSSTGALALEQVPEQLLVIGGGYIGLEMGSVWRRLGAKVTVVEFLDRIVPGMDGELGKQLQRVLSRQGMTFRLSTKVTGAETRGDKVHVSVEPVAGGAAETIEADVVLVAAGRRPYAEGLGLAEAGVGVDEKGRIKTDGRFQTTAPGIYAIGDVIAGPMLAHKAEEEGVAAVELMAGQAGHVNYETVPGVVYTWPEAASVGCTEEELKAAGVEYRVGKFPFMANSRARCTGETDGFVKLLADAGSDRLLGAHIIGPDAGHLIHEVVTAMEFGGSAEDVARSFHAHPTLNEAIKEAALAVAGRPIHI